MNIRTARLDDLGALDDIYNQAILAGGRTAHTQALTTQQRAAWFDEHPAASHPILVAAIDNTVVGYLSISPYRPGRMALAATAEVSFYIDFAYQRQGLASLLLQHAIALCPAMNIRTLLAILLEVNQGSIRLLQKHGFAEWGYLPGVAEFDDVTMGQLVYGLSIGDQRS